MKNKLLVQNEIPYLAKLLRKLGFDTGSVNLFRRPYICDGSAAPLSKNEYINFLTLFSKDVDNFPTEADGINDVGKIIVR